MWIEDTGVHVWCLLKVLLDGLVMIYWLLVVIMDAGGVGRSGCSCLGMFDFLSITGVLNTWIWDGFVIVGLLVVMLGCLFPSIVWISWKVSGAGWSCNEHFDMWSWTAAGFWAHLNWWSWNRVNAGWLAVVCHDIIFIMLWQSYKTGFIWRACGIWFIVHVAFWIIICVKVNEGSIWIMVSVTDEYWVPVICIWSGVVCEVDDIFGYLNLKCINVYAVQIVVSVWGWAFSAPSWSLQVWAVFRVSAASAALTAEGSVVSVCVGAGLLYVGMGLPA